MGEFISVEPKKMVEGAQNIRECSNKYTTISQSLMEKATQMGGIFEGADSQAFTQQVLGFAEELEQMAKKLNLVGDALETQAKNYQNRQDSNVEGASNLSN